MDTTNTVDLAYLRNTARYQRESAAAMVEAAKVMCERAGRMLAAATATRSMLERQRSSIVGLPPA